MANAVNVYIKGELPFNFLDMPSTEESPYLDGKLSLDEHSFLARTFMTPSMGLELKFGADHYVPNDKGGSTATYEFVISGIEAISWVALSRLVYVIEKADGRVDMAVAEDIDNGGSETFDSTGYLDWCRRTSVEP